MPWARPFRLAGVTSLSAHVLEARGCGLEGPFYRHPNEAGFERAMGATLETVFEAALTLSEPLASWGLSLSQRATAVRASIEGQSMRIQPACWIRAVWLFAALFLPHFGWAQFSVGPTCSGGSTDRGILQAALNAIPSTGGTLTIPAVGSPCYIAAVNATVSHMQAAINVSGLSTVTAQFNAGFPSGFPPAGGIINIHNVGNGTMFGTVFNGTYVIVTEVGSCSLGSNCITYQVPSGATNTDPAALSSNSVAEIGLYWLGNNLRVVGMAGGTSSSAAMASVLSTDGADTILTVMSNNVPRNGPTIESVSFLDTSNGNAFAGLDIADSYGFMVLNCGFSGFTGTGTLAVADPQGGAGIVLDGTTLTTQTAHPWTQYALVADNFMQGRLGVTTKNNVSSIVFDANQVQCGTTATILLNSVGLDLGGIWYLTQGGTTGGESTITNQQSQACMVGTLVGGQNNDRIYTKAENGSNACNVGGGLSTICSIGLAVLNSKTDLIFNQTKNASAGLYIDSGSSDNKVYENSTSGALTSGSGDAPLNGLCSATSSCTITIPTWTVASNVVDSAVQAGTAFLGVASTGSFTQTANSTFTADALPVPLQETSLLDANGKEYLGVTPTANAVDFFNITNGATGTPGVVIGAAKGTDTNVTLRLRSQAAGQVILQPGTSGDSTTAVQLQTAGGSVVLDVDTTNSQVGIGVTPGQAFDVDGKFQVSSAGIVPKYNNLALSGNGLPSQVANVDLTLLSANTGPTTLYAVPSTGAGLYRISGVATVTRPATTSSTLPTINISCTDKDSSGTPLFISPALFAGSPTPNATSNTTATSETFVMVCNAKASTNIQYVTTGYASSGATSMQYALHLRVESM